MNKRLRWIVCGTLVAGCVEQPVHRRSNLGVTQQEVEAVRKRVVVTAAPTPQHALDFNYGNKVSLLGYDMTPDEVRPGTNVTVTWYWHCTVTPGDGWHLYTHLDDTSGPRQNHDNDGDVRRAYQPERWHNGEYIVDRQTFEIPSDWESSVVKIHVGLWKGDERLPLVRGRAGEGGRGLAITINTRAQVRYPELEIPRATGSLTIDGLLNEPAWRMAARTGPLVNPNNGSPAGPTDAHGGVRVLWDDQYLYLGWEVTDDHLIETSGGQRDAHYWENDTTELLIDPDGNGRDYYEIEVSPGNHTFDSQQPQPPAGNNFGTLAWNPGLHSAVHLSGTSTLNNDSDVDVGYAVEVAIPWTDLTSGAAHVPPRPGDSWRANFYLMDKPKQGGQRVASWSPPRQPSFHTAERFGKFTFREASPQVGAAAPVAAGESAAGGTDASPAARPNASGDGQKNRGRRSGTTRPPPRPATTPQH